MNGRSPGPSMPIFIALKLHAIKSNPDRKEKDGRDIAELLERNPDQLNAGELESLFAKYGCGAYFPPYRHPVK